VKWKRIQIVIIDHTRKNTKLLNTLQIYLFDYFLKPQVKVI